MNKILFIGSYPNIVEPYKNCFFQTLIYAIADMGIQCMVISPVSVTHYRKNAKRIPKQAAEKTADGAVVQVYYPQYVSYSSKKIGFINTAHLTEASFQRCVLKTIRQNNIQFDITYGHFFLGGGLAAIKAGNIYHKPSFVAYGEHDYQDCVTMPYGELMEKDLQDLSGIIAVSTKNKKELLERKEYSDIPILVAPNGTDSRIRAARS